LFLFEELLDFLDCGFPQKTFCQKTFKKFQQKSDTNINKSIQRSILKVRQKSRQKSSAKKPSQDPPKIGSSFKTTTKKRVGTI